MVMDIYQLVRDSIEEAKKQKNLDLVDKLIEIKLAITAIQEENASLRKSLEIQNSILRHSDGNYVTLEGDPLKIKYCSTCWGNEHKLIQLNESMEKGAIPQCPICFNNWLSARNHGK